MPLSVEKLPGTYKARVHWYVSNWFTNTIHLFKTKKEALKFAKSNPIDGIVWVDWFDPKSNPRVSISNTKTIIDKR